MLDGRDRSTEWWQKAVVVPVRRAWVVVASRLRRKKHGKFDHNLTVQPAARSVRRPHLFKHALLILSIT
jgi:hypothetical protein